MATRRERVVLELEDSGFSTKMAKNAAATALLSRELHNLDRRSVDVGPHLLQSGRAMDSFGTSLSRQGAEVDRFSGRMRILADSLAVFGPGGVAAGGVAAGGIAGLASQMGFATIAMSSLVAASQGVGDALKAMNTAALEPTAANLEKAREAMDQIGPSAQMFVTRFQELRPTLREIRDAAAAGWFPGLTDALDSVERVGPEVADLFEQIGRAGGSLVAEGAAAFAGPEWQQFRTFIGTEGPRALTELGHSVGNVTRALAELWMAFGPINSSFSTWLVDASRGFAEWADGLSATEGFQSFVTYIQTNGPRVADALAAVGKAVVEIVEAIAPLGGPSLQIIESFGKVLAAIADSDLGTPILAAVSALTLLNRTLQVTAALQTRLTGSTALAGGMASGGVLGLGRAGTGGLKATASDLRLVGANWRYLGTSAALAEARQSKALTGMAKGTAVIGGLTVAATGAAEGMGISNSASLALMGTIAGPWGAAVGAGAGALMDLSAALDVSTSSAESFNAALASGDVNQMVAEIAAVEKELANLNDISKLDSVGDFAKGSKLILQDAFANIGIGEFSDTNSDLEARRSVLEGQVEAAQRAQLAEAGFSDALRQTGEDAGFTSGQLLDLASSTHEATAAYWGGVDASIRLGEAIDGVAAAANEGKRGLDASTEGGRDNLTAISNLANAWATTNEAMKDAPAEEVEAAYRKVRQSLIEAAIKMGATKQEAKGLANQLAKPMSIVVKDKTREAVASAKAAIADLRRSIEGKPIIQTVEVKRKYGKNATVGTPGGLPELFGGPGSANGSTVPKDGGPYSDRFPYLLAPGEEVISNRHGQADRNRPLLKAINAGMLAEGGTAGGRRGGSLLVAPGFGSLAELDQLPKSLKSLVKWVDESADALKGEVSARQSLSDSLTSAVSSKITSDLFGATDVWSKGGTFEDVMARLNGDIANGNALSANIAALQGKGLDGPAFDALLAQGDSATIANFAALSAAQLDQFEVRYGDRSKLADSVAAQAAAAAGYTAQIVALQAKVDQTNALLAQLNGIQKAAPGATGSSLAKATKKGAGNASRNRKRG
ncbi:hypothetical protein QI633_11285 [Nocardioides sp. QY071]|uniref:hypothetical protein n=1 Tax=Nocardioides sp. QY071 TaxID=3044187 RepID=UPI002499F6EA|nr:hypothetical protein [Nocardioides sp. QY071]WGY04329.1 hypothetical protein QI633_11285 [Nocardioides sp. QY071]